MSVAQRLTAQTPTPKVTIEQYLAIERQAAQRHEYVDGEVIAMAGEKLPHGIISTNIISELVSQLKGTPCFVVTKDTKVRSGLGVVSAQYASGMFSYPDILVVCGEAEYFDDQSDVIVNPKAIIEVLSPSTELFDRSEKFQRYRDWNKSLKDYMLVAQDKPLIEHYRRQSDDTWNLCTTKGLDAAVVFSSFSCTLKLADVYDRITIQE